MKKRCAVYVRATPLETSYEYQLLEIKKYADERGFTIVKVFRDSAVCSVHERPALRSLHSTIPMDRFDFILTSRLDILCTSSKQLFDLVQLLNLYGIGLISVRENIDTLSKDSALINHFIRVFTFFNSRNMAERVHAGRSGQMQKGHFGAKTKIDRAEMQRLAELGLTKTEIARRLNCALSTVSVGLQDKRYLKSRTYLVPV